MITIIAANKTSLKLNGCATSGRPLGNPLVKNKVVRIMLSSEYSEFGSWDLNPVSGQFGYGGRYLFKCYANQVRAAVAFKL